MHFKEKPVRPLGQACGCGRGAWKHDRAAFSLVEVVLALGIFSFALMAIIGLFMVGINTSKESAEQIQAANLASLLISTRRTIPTNVIANFALPPLNTAYSTSGTYVTNVNGVALDGTLSGPRAYNLFYQIGTNAATGTRLAQVHLLLWWPTASTIPLNNPGNRYEITTQVALP